MQKRQLGQSSLHVYPITFGGNVFGWTADEAMSFKLLDAFLGAGFNFVDTADVYSRWHPGNSGGESEVIIGNWLKARGGRDKVILATKLGIEMAPGKKGLSKKYMVQAVEDSLRHLGFAVGEARVGRVIDLEVEAADPAEARAEVERMCEQLLTNPLIESYEIEIAAE